MRMSASSAVVPASPGSATSVTSPIEFAPFPFESGVPTVSWPDTCCGGAHDELLSGAPWVRLPLVQATKEGTSDARSGDAPLGRGYPVSGWSRPILLPVFSVNQSALSAPGAIPSGSLAPVGIVNSLVTAPAVVIRPILLASASVNQSAPSEPATIPEGPLAAVGIVNSVIVPLVVIRPILLPAYSVNQRSDPNAAMPEGSLPEARL